MFRFLHAADLHLDSPLRGLESYPDAPVEQIRSASRRTLDNLVDLAIEEEVAFVLLAGDIYDGDWKDYNTGIFFAQRMGRLREAGIQVFIISGNHDAASVIAKTLRPPDNVHFFSTRAPATVRLENLSVAIHGQGYQSRDTREDLAVNYPPAETGLFNIGLLHTALNGRPGHEPYAPTTLDILKSRGYDYWALGHVHRREVVCRQPWVVFPGCPQGRHIKETGAKGCSLVTVDEGQVVSVEQRGLDVLRWQDIWVDISTCEDQDSLFQTVRQHMEEAKGASDGRPVALRLTLTGTPPIHNWLHQDMSHWTEECRAMAAGLGDVWLEKVVLNTRHQKGGKATLDEGSPLAGLIESIQKLNLNQDLYDRIPELEELQSKLPPELSGDDDFFNPSRPDQLTQWQEDVRGILLARLLGKGEPHENQTP